MADNKKLIMLAILIIAVFFMMKGKAPLVDEGDRDVGITFRVRTVDGAKQALVGGVAYPSPAEGQFGVTIQNQKEIPIYNIDFVSKTDTVVSSPFDSAIFSWSSIVQQNPGSPPSTEISTSWFGLEAYALLEQSNPFSFTFNFDYDYDDAEGVRQTNVPLSGTAYVEIYPDHCSDSTPVHGCNGDGDKCVYTPGTGVAINPDMICCVYMGGTWDGNSCEMGCIEYGLQVGECLQSAPSDLPIRQTYCAATNTMEERCGAGCTNGVSAQCWDAYGNPSIDCIAGSPHDTCKFTDYGAQGVLVNIVGQATMPPFMMYNLKSISLAGVAYEGDPGSGYPYLRIDSVSGDNYGGVELKNPPNYNIDNDGVSFEAVKIALECEEENVTATASNAILTLVYIESGSAPAKVIDIKLPDFVVSYPPVYWEEYWVGIDGSLYGDSALTNKIT